MLQKKANQKVRVSGFHPLGLTFCFVMEALASHTYLTWRFTSGGLAIGLALVVALVCLAMSFLTAKTRWAAR